MFGHLNNTKSRRAILGFVGRFAKSLFGVSTEGDTRILAQQIREIHEDFDACNENTLAITQTFLSYIVKADKKFELLNQAIKLTDEATHLAATLAKQAIDNEFMFTRLFNILHLYGAQYTDVLLDSKTHLLQTEQAIQTLLQGYLPYYFVPLEDLHTAIQTIGHELSTIGPFRLTHTEIGFYYHLEGIAFKLDNYKLLIKIWISVTTTTTVTRRMFLLTTTKWP